MSFKVINGKLHFIEDYSSASLKNKSSQKHGNDKNFDSILKDKINNKGINNKTSNINNKLNNELNNKIDNGISNDTSDSIINKTKNRVNNNINNHIRNGIKESINCNIKNTINYEISNKDNGNIINKNSIESNGFIENTKHINLKKESFIISKHALERLQTRNINLTEEDMNSINKAINEAEGKGSKECLILCKDAALITSIKNRTIITVMTKEESKNSVFTNIDSAVII